MQKHMQVAYKEGNMEKKEYKRPESYKQKVVYLDRNNEFQSEALTLLDMCGHKQAKFVGLLVHDFISRYGIDIETIEKEVVLKYISYLEFQATNVHNTMMMVPMNALNMQAMGNMMMSPLQNKIKPSKKRKKTGQEEDFIDEGDMNDMNEALAAFGV